MESWNAFRRHFFVRRVDAADLLETFLVCAVAAVLLIRFLLKLTGYPQIGSQSLHIAHMLFGGLLMLGAILLLLVSISRLPTTVAAVVGGVGFGMFIDELGKFVTRDNDYFFRPAIALIYLVFVLLALMAQAMGRYYLRSPQAALVNAMELTKEAVIRDMDAAEKARALELLARCDPADPVVSALTSMLQRVETVPSALSNPVVRLRQIQRALYRRLVAAPWFSRLLFAIVVLCAALALVEAALSIGPAKGHLAVGAWAQFVSSALMGALVALGLARLGISRLHAYRMFNRAALLSIFLTQVFAFYREQLRAITGLAVSILVWLALRYMIRQEEEMARKVRG